MFETMFIIMDSILYWNPSFLSCVAFVAGLLEILSCNRFIEKSKNFLSSLVLCTYFFNALLFVAIAFGHLSFIIWHNDYAHIHSFCLSFIGSVLYILAVNRKTMGELSLFYTCGKLTLPFDEPE